MKLRIRETGEVVELLLRDKNGISWTADFIDSWNGLGDEPHQIQYDADDDIYFATQEVAEWWVEAIKAQQKLEDRMEELEEEYGEEAVRDAVRHVAYTDLPDHIEAMHQALDEAFNNNNN